MDTVKIAVGVLVWSFIVIVMYQIGNTMIFGYVEPVMEDLAYQARNNVTGGYVNYENYKARVGLFTGAFNIACFILLLTPYAYLFVRMLLKKEQQVTAYPGTPGGGW